MTIPSAQPKSNSSPRATQVSATGALFLSNSQDSPTGAQRSPSKPISDQERLKFLQTVISEALSILDDVDEDFFWSLTDIGNTILIPYQEQVSEGIYCKRIAVFRLPLLEESTCLYIFSLFPMYILPWLPAFSHMYIYSIYNYHTLSRRTCLNQVLSYPVIDLLYDKLRL